MVAQSIWALCLAAAFARAQDTSESTTPASGTSADSRSAASTDRTEAFSAITFTGSIETITTSIPTSAFTGSEYSYLSYTGQVIRSSSSVLVLSGSQNASASSTSSNSQITRSSNTESLTQILGGTASRSGNGTATASSTSSAALPVNTQPCNLYPEFCNRSYGNITEVCAHNAAFVVPNNAGSNQELSIEDQLNDGIRMLQGETWWINETVYNCHSSCDLLNAGTLQSELEVVAAWLARNPFEVLTMLIGNSVQTAVENYVPAFQNSGVAQYLYEPEFVPQHRDQWPTLGEMILSGKRLVIFMDYKANQDSVPYILDEFSHMWETPFSPQNQSFPCTQQRPPDLNQTLARDQYMYLANHNLNTAIDLGALLGTASDDPLLVPNTVEINQTNGQALEFGQLGLMSDQCTQDWGRPPKFLLVDYYNRGDPEPGSVFEVAARANNVTYNRPCCGAEARSPAPIVRSSLLALAAAVIFAVLLS